MSSSLETVRTSGCSNTLQQWFIMVERERPPAGCAMHALRLLYLSSASMSSLIGKHPSAHLLMLCSQPFWGDMVAAAGAGPNPIHHKSLTAQNLSEAITFCLTPSAKQAAESISSQMATERGVDAAVQSFHANLPFATMQCDILPDQPASWTYKKTNIKLSRRAAQILLDNASISSDDIQTYVAPFLIVL